MTLTGEEIDPSVEQAEPARFVDALQLISQTVSSAQRRLVPERCSPERAVDRNAFIAPLCFDWRSAEYVKVCILDEAASRPQTTFRNQSQPPAHVTCHSVGKRLVNSSSCIGNSAPFLVTRWRFQSVDSDACFGRSPTRRSQPCRLTAYACAAGLHVACEAVIEPMGIKCGCCGDEHATTIAVRQCCDERLRGATRPADPSREQIREHGLAYARSSRPVRNKQLRAQQPARMRRRAKRSFGRDSAMALPGVTSTPRK